MREMRNDEKISAKDILNLSIFALESAVKLKILPIGMNLTISNKRNFRYGSLIHNKAKLIETGLGHLKMKVHETAHH